MADNNEVNDQKAPGPPGYTSSATPVLTKYHDSVNAFSEALADVKRVCEDYNKSVPEAGQDHTSLTSEQVLASIANQRKLCLHTEIASARVWKASREARQTMDEVETLAVDRFSAAG